MTPPVPSTVQQPRVDEEFRYGYRYVPRPGANGQVEYDQVPLTLEDVLHPQEDDFITENTLHNKECNYISSVCRSRLANRRGAMVLSDCLINWGDEGVRNLSPDVAVIFDVADPDLQRGIFYTAEEGTRPSLVIENVSPHTRSNDVIKIDLYHRVRIPDYVMIDQQREDGPRTIIRYTWSPSGYVPVIRDDNCALLSVVGLRMCLRNDRVVLLDAVTDEEILDYTGLDRAHEAERQGRAEAERQMQAEREIRAAVEREIRAAAERQVQAEREIRAAAERQVQAEREIRAAAERQVQTEAALRQQAEELAQREARAREEVEQRLQALEAELRRLRGAPRHEALSRQRSRFAQDSAAERKLGRARVDH